MWAIFCLLLLTRICQAAERSFRSLDDTTAVAKVDNPVKRSRTLIHIRDCHWVPYEYIEAELLDQSNDSKAE